MYYLSLIINVTGNSVYDIDRLGGREKGTRVGAYQHRLDTYFTGKSH